MSVENVINVADDRISLFAYATVQFYSILSAKESVGGLDRMGKLKDIVFL